MKFDGDRAMAWVAAFDFPRSTGTPGEVRAADMLAEQFERTGWQVARAETRTGCRLCSMLMLLFMLVLYECASVWKAVQLSVPGAPFVTHASLFLAATAALVGVARLLLGKHAARVARERVAAAREAPRVSRMVNLVASWPSAVDPPTRVLIVTPVDNPVPLGYRSDVAWIAVLLVLLGISIRGMPAIAMAWIRVAFFLGSACFFARYWLREGHPAPGDNRSGLAILAELAQALPAKLHERVEIRLAAVGHGATGQLGALTLADDIRLHWPSKPTLVINLDSAGSGSSLSLSGAKPALGLGCAAAADLWIPHRVVRWMSRPAGHGPFRFSGIDAVSLSGDRSASSVDPATLAATAQLATELALRWSRREGGTTQPVSLARSSQKPG